MSNECDESRFSHRYCELRGTLLSTINRVNYGPVAISAIACEYLRSAHVASDNAIVLVPS